MDMVCWHLITHGWNWISSINIHFVFTSKCAFINVLLLGLQFGKYHCKHCMGTTILSYFWTQEFHGIIQHRYDWLVVGFLNFPSDKTGCFWILLLIVSDLHLDDLITNSIDPILILIMYAISWNHLQMELCSYDLHLYFLLSQNPIFLLVTWYIRGEE